MILQFLLLPTPPRHRHQCKSFSLYLFFFDSQNRVSVEERRMAKIKERHETAGIPLRNPNEDVCHMLTVLH
jgi:hypothetical protein